MLEKCLILCAFPCIITIAGEDKFPRSIERSEDTDEMARDEARHGIIAVFIALDIVFYGTPVQYRRGLLRGNICGDPGRAFYQNRARNSIAPQNDAAPD